ncbi:MAG: hypothetical protein ABIS14_06515 [Sphingomonas sp.]
MSILPALALVTLALTPVIAGEPAPFAGADVTQLTIRQRIIIRIPKLDVAVAPSSDPHHWVEKKGPQCVPMGEIAGADVTASDQVDLVKVDGSRLRAKFDEACPSLDFYSGFYLKRTPDGMVCAGRDAFRSRSGGSCQIATFRGLRERRWLDNLPLIRKR